MQSNNRTLEKFELYSLYALVFFLPLFEAPKNIAVAAYLILWATRAFLSNSWGGAWGKWDTLSVSIILAGIGSIYFGLYPTNNGTAAIGDILSYTLVFMCLQRTPLNENTIRNIFVIAIGSTALTLGWGYWLHFHSHATGALQLNSVGHVNHSAIYLGIIIAMTLTMAIIEKSIKTRLIYLTLAIFFIYSIFIMAARGAIVPLALFIALVIFIHTKNTKSMIIYATASIIALTAVLSLAPGILNKTTGNFSNENYTSKRLELANTAIAAAKESPIFGVGLNNFRKITEPEVKSWVEQGHRTYNPDHFFYTSHAHNLYFNTLAERGALGLLAVLGLLGMLGLHLFSTRPQQGQSASVLWYGAMGGWIIVVFGGIFNTTLHHEHGMLAMMLLGGWLSSQKT